MKSRLVILNRKDRVVSLGRKTPRILPIEEFLHDAIIGGWVSPSTHPGYNIAKRVYFTWTQDRFNVFLLDAVFTKAAWVAVASVRQWDDDTWRANWLTFVDCLAKDWTIDAALAYL